MDWPDQALPPPSRGKANNPSGFQLVPPSVEIPNPAVVGGDIDDIVSCVARINGDINYFSRIRTRSLKVFLVIDAEWSWSVLCPLHAYHAPEALPFRCEVNTCSNCHFLRIFDAFAPQVGSDSAQRIRVFLWMSRTFLTLLLFSSSPRAFCGSFAALREAAMARTITQIEIRASERAQFEARYGRGYFAVSS